MDIKKCFEPDCKFEAEYASKCSFPRTYYCKQHAIKHIELSNKTHAFEFIFRDPCEGTKEAILEFLAKEKSEHIKLKIKTLASLSQYLLISEKYIKELIKHLDSTSDVINNCCLKIKEAKKTSKSMEDPILELLSLQPNEAVEKVKIIISANSDWYESAKLFCGFSEKIGNVIENFIKDKFEASIEKRFIKIESILENHNKAITLANSELANFEDSISLIVNEKPKSLKGLENVKEPIQLKAEKKASLLNFQIKISNDFNTELKKTKKALLDDIGTLRNKTAEILSKPNNPVLERIFRATCSTYQANSSLYDRSLMKAYQNYLNAYQQKTSLYNIRIDYESSRTKLIIYNTETGIEEKKFLQTPEPLGCETCITQLPNGKLFCFGNHALSGITVLVDVNGEVEVLPSGFPCHSSSCIYFNNSIYCFGGFNGNACLTLSSKFDLYQNRWIQLTPMPKAACLCNSIILNGDILISGVQNSNLLLYSIDINSFSTIPYEFEVLTRKILINADRLYLIESESIFESEIGNYTNWRRIRKLPSRCNDSQVYCSYNKGGIYIGCAGLYNTYHKFCLKGKSFRKL